MWTVTSTPSRQKKTPGASAYIMVGPSMNKQLVEPSIHPKPWWAKLVTKDGWLTIGTCIYAPVPDPEHYLHVVEHERAHSARQQIYGVVPWLWRYLTDPMFRYHEELFGYAVQLAWFKRHRPEHRAAELRDVVQRMLPHTPLQFQNSLAHDLEAWSDIVLAGRTMTWDGGVQC